MSDTVLHLIRVTLQTEKFDRQKKNDCEFKKTKPVNLLVVETEPRFEQTFLRTLNIFQWGLIWKISRQNNCWVVASLLQRITKYLEIAKLHMHYLIDVIKQKRTLSIFRLVLCILLREFFDFCPGFSLFHCKDPDGGLNAKKLRVI